MTGTAVWREFYVRLAIQIILFVAFIPVNAIAMHLLGDKWLFFGALYGFDVAILRIQVEQLEMPKMLAKFSATWRVWLDITV
jgi:hypothetical protein